MPVGELRFTFCAYDVISNSNAEVCQLLLVNEVFCCSTVDQGNLLHCSIRTLHLTFNVCFFGIYIASMLRWQMVSASSCPSRTLWCTNSPMTWQQMVVGSSPSRASSFRIWWQFSQGSFLAPVLSCSSGGVCYRP